jgi:hypothetical protein
MKKNHKIAIAEVVAHIAGGFALVINGAACGHFATIEDAKRRAHLNGYAVRIKKAALAANY